MQRRWLSGNTLDGRSEVVVSNPAYGRNYFLPRTRYPVGLLSAIGCTSAGSRWNGSSRQCQDYKYASTSFADWLWLVIAPALGLKTILDVLDTKSTRTHKHTHGYRICLYLLHHTSVTTMAMYAM